MGYRDGKRRYPPLREHREKGTPDGHQPDGYQIEDNPRAQGRMANTLAGNPDPL